MDAATLSHASQQDHSVEVLREDAERVSCRLLQNGAEGHRHAFAPHAAPRFLAREPPDLAEVRYVLDCVISETYRADGILGGIREQIKKVPSRQESFDLSEAIEEVIKLVRAELFKQRVSVQTRLTQGLPLVQGDRVHCSRSC